MLRRSLRRIPQWKRMTRPKSPRAGRIEVHAFVDTDYAFPACQTGLVYGKRSPTTPPARNGPVLEERNVSWQEESIKHVWWATWARIRKCGSLPVAKRWLIFGSPPANPGPTRMVRSRIG